MFTGVSRRLLLWYHLWKCIRIKTQFVHISDESSLQFDQIYEKRKNQRQNVVILVNIIFYLNGWSTSNTGSRLQIQVVDDPDRRGSVYGVLFQLVLYSHWSTKELQVVL